jgi:membrane associated rhomboid family serine protease
MAVRINIPPVTRFILILLLALSFLYTLGRYRKLPSTPNPRNPAKPLVPYLTLVPVFSIYYPWTLLTATFVERNIFSLLVNGATIFFGGKYLERAWGSKEFGKVVLVATVIPNTIAIPMYIIWEYISGSPTRAWTPISGGVTLQAAFLVAFKQLVPEHTVAIFKGFVKMRVKHFPAVFLLVNSISGLFLGTDTAAIFAWVGLITAWTYLRFYKRQPDLSGTATGSQELRGDASETFAFASFFPDKLQPAIASFCDQIYILLIHMRVCTPFSNEDIESGNQQAAARGEAGLPSLLNNGGRTGRGTGRREEAERRRALALQALDQRLSAANANKPPNQPLSVAPTLVDGHESLGRTDYTPDEAART